MPKRITYLEKRDGTPRGAFRAHWSTKHADIARDLPGVVAYRQNHVQPSSVLPLADDAYPIDGIVELWFADESVTQAGFESDVAERLAVDELNFLSGLTGGPVSADEPYEVWPYKLWLLARWCSETAVDHGLVKAWADQLDDGRPGALGVSTNFLKPHAPLLTRQALRSELQIPQVAIAFGFSNEASATEAATRITESLDAMQGVLERMHGYLVEELVII